MYKCIYIILYIYNITSKYDNLIILGDFNAIENMHINYFCNAYNLRCMINKTACYKSPDKPLCIDLIFKICPYLFQNVCVIEIRLVDFH